MVRGTRVDPRLVLAWIGLVVIAGCAWLWPTLLAPNLLVVVPLAASTFASVRAVAYLSVAALVPAVWLLWTGSDDPAPVLITRIAAWTLIAALSLVLTRSRVRAEAAAQYSAALDPLTGLPNRRQLDDYLHYAMESRSSITAVLCVDLDGFKSVNDRLGHPIGDDVLVALASRMRDCLRSGDMVSRVGGDEFVIVCAAVRGLDEVSDVCARIVAEVARSVETRRGPVTLSATVGALVVRPGSGLTAREVVHDADLLLIGQKASGKGSYRLQMTG